MVNNGDACSISVMRHRLWVEEKVFRLSQQIFKAAPHVLQVLHPLQSRQQTMDALAATVPAQSVDRDTTDCPNVFISSEHVEWRHTLNTGD